MAPRKLGSVTTKKSDEHFQLIVNDNLALCQRTMMVPINKAQNTADKAHERLDCMNTRLTQLDDPKVGMVQTIWNERNHIKNLLYGIGVMVLISMTANFVMQGNSKLKITKEDLKEAVKAALVEMK